MSEFARYEAYKDSGVEWLGEIPEHWEIWKLSHAFEQIGSGTTPRSDVAKYYEGGTIAWLNTGDLNDNELFDCDKKVTELALKDYSVLKVFSENSLVIAMYGATIGKLALLRFKTTVNQACCVFSGGSQIELKYLFYSFIGIREYIVSMANGGGQPNISQNILRNIKLPIPEKLVQQKIISFLDQKTTEIDEAITKKQRLIELLKEQKAILINQAVTKGLNPNVPMRDSGVEWIGDIPAHWGLCALGYLANINTGATPDRDKINYWNGNIPWVKTGEVNYSLIKETEEYITEQGLKKSSTRIASKGTILMAMYGQGVTRGRVSILDMPAAYNQACAAISVRSDILNEYVYYYFVAAYKFIRDVGNETSQMNLSSGYISKIKITIPHKDEQKDIVLRCKKIEHLFVQTEDAEKKGIEKLKEFKQTLIAHAVTGKIKV